MSTITKFMIALGFVVVATGALVAGASAKTDFTASPVVGDFVSAVPADQVNERVD